MVDVRIHPQRHKNIGNDIPIFAGALILVGGAIGALIVLILDKLLHRKSP